MAGHIGVKCSESLIREVSEASSFRAMKRSTHNEEAVFRKLWGDNFSFYRKGLSQNTNNAREARP